MIPSEKPNDRTHIEAVAGYTPDISEYVNFDLYELVWYHTEKYPSVIKEHQALGRWMGVAVLMDNANLWPTDSRNNCATCYS